MDYSYLIDGVQKKVLHTGKSDPLDFPEGSKVTFHFQTHTLNDDGEIQDCVDDSKKIGRPMELILGKKFKMPVWEVCVKTMTIDEVAEFTVKKSVGLLIHIHWCPKVIVNLLVLQTVKKGIKDIVVE